MITRHEAGPDAKAPAVFLNDKAIAEIRGLRDGRISEQEIIDELTRANVPRRQSSKGC